MSEEQMDRTACRGMLMALEELVEEDSSGGARMHVLLRQGARVESELLIRITRKLEEQELGGDIKYACEEREGMFKLIIRTLHRIAGESVSPFSDHRHDEALRLLLELWGDGLQRDRTGRGFDPEWYWNGKTGRESRWKEFRLLVNEMEEARAHRWAASIEDMIHVLESRLMT